MLLTRCVYLFSGWQPGRTVLAVILAVLGSAGAVLGLLLWWPAAVFGHDNPNNPFARPESTSVDVEYEGTLICFRCDIAPSPENRARCEQEGHLPMLRRVEGYMHALDGSTNTITTKLGSEELHGKKVKVKGIYYPKTNQVLVEEVIPLGR